MSTTDDSAGLMEDQGLKELMDISGQLVEGIGEDTVLETMVRSAFVRSAFVQEGAGGGSNGFGKVCVYVYL